MVKRELRCRRCNRKLAVALFTWISIKCPRCGYIHTEKAGEPQ
ncbi:Com family DNA-binding transcriptional regulator [Alloalcanivorax xenomutans]